MLFEISYQLSKVYPGLTPLEIDRTSYTEIIELYADTKEVVEKNDNTKADVIRRPAGDDWF